MQNSQIINIFALFGVIVLIMTGCNDEHDKNTHNHVYSSDTSSTTETSSTSNTKESTATAPEAEKEEPTKEEPQPKFRDRNMVLYMEPAGSRCFAVSGNFEDSNNFTYNLYCNENNANVYHENVPEYLLGTVSPYDKEKELEKTFK